MVVTGRTGPQYREIADEAYWKYIPDRLVDVVSLKQKIDRAQWMNSVPGLRFIVNQILARMDDVFNFLPFFFRLLWAAIRFNADIVHANNEPLCNRAALLVGKILKIPTVCHVRGTQDGSRAMRFAYKLVDHFIPVSNWVSDSIQKILDIPENKISVVYDGLELDTLDINADGNVFREKYGIPEDCFAVGLVGLLIPWKGQEVFIDAAKLLRSKIPDLKMVIVGGTPDDCESYEDMLRNRVKQEELEDLVLFTGHIADMPPAYNGLDIVVSASTSPEPLGTVVIESMVMARPLIGPNHGGAAEMMIHDKTGLLFKHGEAGSLAEQIERFYSDETLRRTLAKNARDHALATFSVARHAEGVQAVYESLLNS